MSRAPYAQHGLVARVCYLSFGLVWRIGVGVRVSRAIVLCYHGVKTHEAPRFAWQVRRVAQRAVAVQELTASSPPGGPLRNCTAGPPSPARTEQAVGNSGRGDWASRGQTNKSLFPSPAVCFTFDDGFANLLDNALPILRQHGVPACIFVVSDNLGDRPRWRIESDHPDANERVMTAEELRRVADSDLITIGSHTCTHPDLAQLSPRALDQELRESRRQLSDLIGRPIEDLALPHGSFTPAVLDAALAAGYGRVYTLDPTPHMPGGAGPQVIGRFLMSPDVWRIEFLLTCAGAYAWLHPWRRLVRRLRGCRRRPASHAPKAEVASV